MGARTNRDTTDSGKERRGRPASTLAEPEAANRIGDAFGQRLTESIDSTGKALTILAGLGAFFFGAGYFVEWQRYKHGGLPPEEILPLIPTSQVAAAGVRELVISFLFMGLTLLLLGFVLVRAARWTQGRTGRLSRGANQVLASDVGFPTAVVGIFILLIVPFGVIGVLVAAILAGLLYFGLSLIRRFLEAGDGARFPLWRLALAVGLAAVVLSVARQAEFPERRPDAVVWLVSGEKLEGDYLASDSNKILLRIGKADCERKCLIQDRRCERECKPPKLIVIRSSEVSEVEVTKSTKLLPLERSLLDYLAIPLLPDLPLTCIPPECRWDGDTRIGPSSFL